MIGLPGLRPSSSSSLPRLPPATSTDSTLFRLLVLSPDWERMGFVDDDGESLARQFADLVLDDRELLQGGDDDRLAVFQRLLQLAARGVDVLHDAERLLEGPHRPLELPVQHAAVGDDDDASRRPARSWASWRVDKLMGEPSDGLALAAPGLVLDQVNAARCRSSGHRPRQAANTVELVVAGEDERHLAGLLALVVLLFDDLDEVLRPSPARCPGSRSVPRGRRSRSPSTRADSRPRRCDPMLNGRKRVLPPTRCVVM